jgi:hypothetical protein
VNGGTGEGPTDALRDLLDRHSRGVKPRARACSCDDQRSHLASQRLIGLALQRLGQVDHAQLARRGLGDEEVLALDCAVEDRARAALGG